MRILLWDAIGWFPNLPQAYQPKQSSAGVAVGSFRGEQSLAVGVSTISESGRYLQGQRHQQYPR
ncbi:YadA-like family protein [Dyella sp. Tek66A03]|uniref:YadA-like family protein n=1 Tax=Dyella sp. Tek66A03 TaxID=3458298 RepID=UPI00403E8760